ncbi:MAG: hypothetical protein R2734_15600 [Nocardioides sp.]
MSDLGIGTLQNMGQAVRPSPGSAPGRGAYSRPRAAIQLIVLDEPTAALGVRESNQVLRMIGRSRRRLSQTILISHNMLCSRWPTIRIQRLGGAAPAMVTRRRP